MAKKFVDADTKKRQIGEFEKALNNFGAVESFCFVVNTEQGTSIGVKVAEGGIWEAGNLALEFLGSIGQHADEADFRKLCMALSDQLIKLPRLVREAKAAEAGEKVDKNKLS